MRPRPTCHASSTASNTAKRSSSAGQAPRSPRSSLSRTPRAKRTGRGSLAGRLRLTDDWDTPAVNDTIARDFGLAPHSADLPEIVNNAGFRHLPITADHAVVAGRLRLLHRDPFDRMLIAQARCEGLTLATRDPQIHRYDVALLDV